MARRHYIIYADESDRKGKYYSNFFGGTILEASDQQSISADLNSVKTHLGLNREVKWQYTDATTVDRYIQFIIAYFEFVRAARLKVRIMFTQNIHEPRNLTREHLSDSYFILYYQMIKHSFGLAHCNPRNIDHIFVSIYPDTIPDTKDRREKFLDYLSRIDRSSLFRGKNINFPRDQITDVDSKNHVILQGLDLILGSMCWRLNDRHKEKPDGELRRGKRTIAKEKLYKEINRQIREIYPNFNIGVSTATRNGKEDRWAHPYRHWLFMPTTYVVNRDNGKRRDKNDPR
jgi:hypothetical protein